MQVYSCSPQTIMWRLLIHSLRYEKRNLFRNLKMLIIDDISLVDSDMLYKIDLRLREITQINLPFGNISIFALGDLMQMRPVKGKFTFLTPRNSQFYLTSQREKSGKIAKHVSHYWHSKIDNSLRNFGVCQHKNN